MPSATTPATVAATAATAGTVRVRWRAASRTAYRVTSGSRREKRASTATTTGTSRIIPSTETTAAAAIEDLAVAAGAEDGQADAAEQQHQADERRAVAGAAVAATTGEHGDDVLARGDPGRHHGGEEGAEQPEAGDAQQVQRLDLERAQPAVGEVLHDREQRPADAPGRAPRPSTAAVAPSTTPAARMTRRACFGVPPLAAISASVRCWRRAPTANAGPASSTTSSRAITTTSTSAAM